MLATTSLPQRLMLIFIIYDEDRQGLKRNGLRYMYPQTWGLVCPEAAVRGSTTLFRATTERLAVNQCGGEGRHDVSRIGEAEAVVHPPTVALRCGVFNCQRRWRNLAIGFGRAV